MAWISFKTSLEEHKKQGMRSLVAQMITLLLVDARALPRHRLVYGSLLADLPRFCGVLQVARQHLCQWSVNTARRKSSQAVKRARRLTLRSVVHPGLYMLAIRQFNCHGNYHPHFCSPPRLASAKPHENLDSSPHRSTRRQDSRITGFTCSRPVKASRMLRTAIVIRRTLNARGIS